MAESWRCRRARGIAPRAGPDHRAPCPLLCTSRFNDAPPSHYTHASDVISLLPPAPGLGITVHRDPPAAPPADEQASAEADHQLQAPLDAAVEVSLRVWAPHARSMSLLIQVSRSRSSRGRPGCRDERVGPFTHQQSMHVCCWCCYMQAQDRELSVPMARGENDTWAVRVQAGVLQAGSAYSVRWGGLVWALMHTAPSDDHQTVRLQWLLRWLLRARRQSRPTRASRREPSAPRS